MKGKGKGKRKRKRKAKRTKKTKKKKKKKKSMCILHFVVHISFDATIDVSRNKHGHCDQTQW